MFHTNEERGLREQENLIREAFIHPTEDYANIYCSCSYCGQQKVVNVAWFHKALEQLGADLNDEFGQRVLDISSIYAHVDDAFARSAVENGWRVYNGYLYCPRCLDLETSDDAAD